MSTSPVLSEAALEQRSLFQRLSDWLFGRDYFISYRWSDGRDYALKLATRLRAENYDCFLDSDSYLKGDDWRKIGRRELRKTSRLILVASPEVHGSEPVARELEIFGGKQSRIFAIEFGESLSSSALPESAVLRLLGNDILRQREPESALNEEPSEAVIGELRRTFTMETTAVLRMRVIKATAVLLFFLFVAMSVAAGLARWQYTRNLKNSAYDDALRATSLAEEKRGAEAVAYFSRSLSRNPNEPFVFSSMLRLIQEQPPDQPEQIDAAEAQSVSINGAGDVILILNKDGSVKLWRDGAGDQANPIPEAKMSVVALSPGGRFAVVAEKTRWKRFDLTASFHDDSWNEGVGVITALSMDDRGSTVFGNDDGEVWLDEKGDGVACKRGGLPKAISEVRFHDNPWRLAAKSQSSEVRVWQSEKDRSPLEYLLDEENYDWFFGDIALSNSGPLWIAECVENFEAGQERWTTFSHRLDKDTEASVQKLRSRDGSALEGMMTGSDGSACIAWLSSQRLLSFGVRESEKLLPGLAACALSADGYLVITAQRTGELNRWLADGLQPVSSGFTAIGIKSLKANDDGSRVVATGPNGTFLFRFPPRLRADATQWSELSVLPASFVPVKKSDGRIPASEDWKIERRPDSLEQDGKWLLKSSGVTIPVVHPMTEEEAEYFWDAAPKSYSEAAYTDYAGPVTLAVVSTNKNRVITAAGSEPLQIRSIPDLSIQNKLKPPDPPFGKWFTKDLILSEDGGRILVVWVNSNNSHIRCYQLFDMETGAPQGGEQIFDQSETVWDTTADLGRMLVSASGELSVRDCATGRLIGKPVSLPAPCWQAFFDVTGKSFVGVTRSGFFRVWRSADALPISSEICFDPEPHEEGEEHRRLDSYRVAFAIEPGSSLQAPFSRIAFLIENNNTTETVPPVYRVFDFGIEASGDDYREFAALAAKIYGVSLAADGTLTRMEPPDRAGLEAEYLRGKSWDAPAMLELGRWFINRESFAPSKPLTRVK
ncbi:MAG: toll/interleukin-1 receptor domain-containing protein [Luteolibacter sp.]|uniref:toll/interleukin-1 receptor domain-containing protein n=1 Tax=Luteolibacter sp. TaxID=1962973 RepID=UPI003267DFFE